MSRAGRSLQLLHLVSGHLQPYQEFPKGDAGFCPKVLNRKEASWRRKGLGTQRPVKALAVTKEIESNARHPRLKPREEQWEMTGG